MEILKQEFDKKFSESRAIDHLVQIKSELGIRFGEVMIKSEPPDPEEVCSKENVNYIENMTVKIEPFYYESGGDESMDSSEPRLFIDEDIKNDFKGESDDEYESSKRSKNKKNNFLNKDKCNIKPVLKSRPRKDTELIYSEDITKHIEIVTITEEQRQVEHKETLHSRRHMRYKCEYCAVGFVVEEAYMVHMKVHSVEAGPFECELCHSRVKSADILYRHRLRHYRRYRCSICHAVHKDKESAACHVMTDHARQAFLCPHCGRGFKRPAYLKRHVEQQHTKPLRLECPVCQRVFHERSWYRSHVRTHNEEVRTRPSQQTVICDFCSRHFKNKAYLKRHLITHESGCVPCPVCYQVCKNRDVMKTHCRQSHSEKARARVEASCPHCLRICSSRALLNHHIRRMHTDRTKRFQCDHCQRLYLTKGEVRAHIAWSHMRAARPPAHRCACGRVFRAPAQLRAHRARAHPPPHPHPHPHPHQHQHQHQHHAPPDHRCQICGKAFSNKQVLNRHIKGHSGQKYPCTECGLAFKTQSYVKIHYKLKHLHMTRAEIKAQVRRPEFIQIATVKESKVDKIQKNFFTNPEGNVKIKVEKEEENEMHIPLFQTFVGIKRE